ncbi:MULTISPECIES: TetR/AcrR family transcriptional regulator C-terminal domain-containing protein [unclassified Roseitalea]|uniref:TetR/AcrR family transcriptional regulator C-terminal domain-containing protein n=1 Tax=unclassified Roseitalea TaxID=2639107 RepID=UPI00273FBD7D|nr:MULTISPECIES: TetR/AcrR family transcriptional regulator C-terminal domain-containing protein [unclassified Roseitalea]
MSDESECLGGDGPMAEEQYTPRQQEVLEAALGLLVEGGEKAITTAGLARAANCSKESLYKWFGDREGVLAAMISYQASKVRVAPAGSGAQRPAESFRADLVAFGVDLLTVLSGPTSLALNRLAIGQASREGSRLGDLLVARGRHAVAARAKALLEAGRRAGHLRFDDTQAAFDTLYGLVVRDMHVRLMLGESVPATTGDAAIAGHVGVAVDQFFRLYGTEQTL